MDYQDLSAIRDVVRREIESIGSHTYTVYLDEDAAGAHTLDRVRLGWIPPIGGKVICKNAVYVVRDVIAVRDMVVRLVVEPHGRVVEGEEPAICGAV